MAAYREDVRPSDADEVLRITESTGFFSKEEVEIAVWLVRERLEKGEESGYYFIFAENEGRTVGFVCFGPIPATAGSFDVYWIALEDGFQGMGLGKKLMGLAEDRIREMGGRRAYVETASREQYAPTRTFYAACGYVEEARLADFYSPGDSKVILVKEISAK